MLFTRIDHVGLAVRDLEAAIGFYETAFGLVLAHRETILEQGVHEALMTVGAGVAAGDQTGGSYVQLLEPTGPDTPVGRFLARRGEGIHHVGFGVADVRAALAEVAGRGVRLVDERPRHGSMGASIAFLDPRDAGGVLIELVQAAAREG